MLHLVVPHGFADRKDRFPARVRAEQVVRGDGIGFLAAVAAGVDHLILVGRALAGDRGIALAVRAAEQPVPSRARGIAHRVVDILAGRVVALAVHQLAADQHACAAGLRQAVVALALRVELQRLRLLDEDGIQLDLAVARDVFQKRRVGRDAGQLEARERLVALHVDRGRADRQRVLEEGVIGAGGAGIAGLDAEERAFHAHGGVAVALVAARLPLIGADRADCVHLGLGDDLERTERARPGIEFGLCLRKIERVVALGHGQVAGRGDDAAVGHILRRGARRTVVIGARAAFQQHIGLLVGLLAICIVVEAAAVCGRAVVAEIHPVGQAHRTDIPALGQFARHARDRLAVAVRIGKLQTVPEGVLGVCGVELRAAERRPERLLVDHGELARVCRVRFALLVVVVPAVNRQLGVLAVFKDIGVHLDGRQQEALAVHLVAACDADRQGSRKGRVHQVGVAAVRGNAAVRAADHLVYGGLVPLVAEGDLIEVLVAVVGLEVQQVAHRHVDLCGDRAPIVGAGRARAVARRDPLVRQRPVGEDRLHIGVRVRALHDELRGLHAALYRVYDHAPRIGARLAGRARQHLLGFVLAGLKVPAFRAVEYALDLQRVFRAALVGSFGIAVRLAVKPELQRLILRAGVLAHVYHIYAHIAHVAKAGGLLPDILQRERVALALFIVACQFFPGEGHGICQLLARFDAFLVVLRGGKHDLKQAVLAVIQLFELLIGDNKAVEQEALGKLFRPRLRRLVAACVQVIAVLVLARHELYRQLGLQHALGQGQLFVVAGRSLPGAVPVINRSVARADIHVKALFVLVKGHVRRIVVLVRAHQRAILAMDAARLGLAVRVHIGDRRHPVGRIFRLVGLVIGVAIYIEVVGVVNIEDMLQRILCVVGRLARRRGRTVRGHILAGGRVIVVLQVGIGVVNAFVIDARLQALVLRVEGGVHAQRAGCEHMAAQLHIEAVALFDRAAELRKHDLDPLQRVDMLGLCSVVPRFGPQRVVAGRFRIVKQRRFAVFAVQLVAPKGERYLVAAFIQAVQADLIHAAGKRVLRGDQDPFRDKALGAAIPVGVDARGEADLVNAAQKVGNLAAAAVFVSIRQLRADIVLAAGKRAHHARVPGLGSAGRPGLRILRVRRVRGVLLVQ